MNKKFLLSLFGSALCVGLIFSSVNLKTFKSLSIQNIEALSAKGVYSYYNGVPIETAQEGNSGICGIVFEYQGDKYAKCKMSLESVEQYKRSYTWYAWCCESCPNTTYCDYCY